MTARTRPRPRRGPRLRLAAVAAPAAAFLTLWALALSGDFGAPARRVPPGGARRHAADEPNALPPAAPVGASPRVTALADRWVAAVNARNDGAIVYHDVDRYGNLYVALDAPFDSLPAAARWRLVDNLGAYYRSYLALGLGRVPNDTVFAPGVVVVDQHPGPRAESRNGRTRVFR